MEEKTGFWHSVGNVIRSAIKGAAILGVIGLAIGGVAGLVGIGGVGVVALALGGALWGIVTGANIGGLVGIVKEVMGLGKKKESEQSFEQSNTRSQPLTPTRQLSQQPDLNPYAPEGLGASIVNANRGKSEARGRS